MSFDTITIRRENENTIRYGIASSCCPDGHLDERSDTANASDSFEHIDGVFICKAFHDDDAWIYSVEDDCLALFDSEYQVVYNWNDPDPQDEAYVVFWKLRELFRDHWPTLGEIADACRF